jgi:hypothetical protein
MWKQYGLTARIPRLYDIFSLTVFTFLYFAYFSVRVILLVGRGSIREGLIPGEVHLGWAEVKKRIMISGIIHAVSIFLFLCLIYLAARRRQWLTRGMAWAFFIAVPLHVAEYKLTGLGTDTRLSHCYPVAIALISTLLKPDSLVIRIGSQTWLMCISIPFLASLAVMANTANVVIMVIVNLIGMLTVFAFIREGYLADRSQFVSKVFYLFAFLPFFFFFFYIYNIYQICHFPLEGNFMNYEVIFVIIYITQKSKKLFFFFL